MTAPDESPRVDVASAVGVTAAIFGLATVVSLGAALTYAVNGQPEPAVWCTGIAGAHAAVTAALAAVQPFIKPRAKK